jgi:hypothetical protein
MFSPKGSESISAKKTLFANFIRHPEFFTQDLFPHLFKPCTDCLRITFIRCSTGNMSPQQELWIRLVRCDGFMMNAFMCGSVDQTCLCRAAVS